MDMDGMTIEPERATHGAEQAHGAGTALREPSQAVRILVAAGDDDEKGLKDQRQAILHETGVQVEVVALPLIELHDAYGSFLQDSPCPFDIVAVLGFHFAHCRRHLRLLDLRPLLAESAASDPGYDFADFPPQALEYTGYGPPQDGKGADSPLLLIPGIHSGSVIYYYRKDLFHAAGLKPATTWAEFSHAAQTLTSGQTAGHTIVGRAELSLFAVDWYTRIITRGGSLLDGANASPDAVPIATSGIAISALQDLTDSLAFAPLGAASYRWEDSVAAMAEGRAAQMLMWSTSAGSLFDTNRSEYADRIGVALVPADPGRQPVSVRGGFGLGIPATSARIDDAWRVLRCITSARFNKYQTLTYHSDPNRRSTYQDPELTRRLPYLPTAYRAWEGSRICELARFPQFNALKEAACSRLSSALAGDCPAAEACHLLQRDWEAILR